MRDTLKHGNAVQNHATLYVTAGCPFCTGICTRVPHAQQVAKCSGASGPALAFTPLVPFKSSVIPAEQLEQYCVTCHVFTAGAR